MLPADYLERVYAGVLGKLVGVYLGRPFEGWSYERIAAELGDVEYYVNEKFDQPLILTDDDLAGSFGLLRAMADRGSPRELPPQAIGESWLNYIVEGRTILWWGGLGNSTEHTAFLRLKAGVPAPASGSVARNGRVVAEQIGAQIFIDGWAMLAPGDPELAADLARRAASVSHDGEALYAAQLLAAMESMAFVEADIDRLLDAGLAQIPPDATIARLAHDLRAWHAADADWRATRARVAQRYGYDRYPGVCHVVPNHALILLALLHGDGDLSRSLAIVCTAGWDTDCNAGNLGCLLGIRGGLAAFDGERDWRGPVADRLYIPTADGGGAITDAVREAYAVANSGRALRGLPALAPKGGARFQFDLPGSVQGWQAEVGAELAPALLENVAGHSAAGARSLAIRCASIGPGRPARVATATFIPPEALALPGYALLASPTLHSGQQLRAVLEADAGNSAPLTARLFLRSYGPDDAPGLTYGPAVELVPGAQGTLSWRVPDTGGAPIAAIGLEIGAAWRASGTLYLDSLGWAGAPELLLTRAAGTLWRRAWVDGCDQWEAHWPEAFRIVQNRGTGLIMQGGRDWRDYRATATITPWLAEAAGLALRVQGLRRYYALLLVAGGAVRLVKACDGERTLAEAPLAWRHGEAYTLRLEAAGGRLRAWVDGAPLFEVADDDPHLAGGGVGLLVSEGCLSCDAVHVGGA